MFLFYEHDTLNVSIDSRVIILLHLHNLFAKSYKDIQQSPVQGAKIKMSEYVCVAKVIINFGTIIQ